MKKILLISAISLLLPFSVFAEIIYSREPSGYTIFNPVSFEVSFDDFIEDFTCFEEDTHWYFQVCEYYPAPCVTSELIASTTLNYIFTTDLPIGDYYNVKATCYPNPYENEVDLEGNGMEKIFGVVEEEEQPIITIDANFIVSTLAYVGQVFTDTTLLIVLAIGLPLGFWVVKKAISLIPKR